MQFATALYLFAIIGCVDFLTNSTEDFNGARVAPGIHVESLLTSIQVLSSDEFNGRSPGSEGEEKTIAFLRQQFSDLGLSPGNPNGSWIQPVPLIGMTPLLGDTLTVSHDGVDEIFNPGNDYVAWTKHVVDEVQIDAEFVFVGYGAVAPEYDWDDFSDVNVEGKILLFLVNDPPVENAFGGRAMTYYGRWTYKHEIAATKGAVGSFVIHEPGPAGYPWEVVGSSPHGESFDLITDDQNLGRTAIEGWIHQSAAERIFEIGGHDFDDLRHQAADRSFSPILLGVNGKTRVRNSVRTIDSNNFIAKIDGIEAPDDVVMYVAHWDHLGKDESLNNDQIFNGAADNASGTAGLIEVARAFIQAAEPPRRSIAFLAVTAEEQGLLGSKYYGEYPLYPAANTVAAINMDVLNTWGRTHDLTIVGMGQSELDNVASEAATRLGRILNPDPEPEKGFYYRSDHFSFARVGIPAFYADPGIDYLDKPEGYGIEKRERYTNEDYHKPSDEVKPDWDLSGAVEDLTFLYEVGRHLADSETWPEWSELSEFKAIRELQR
jgi:Zn-dependent M28 family amino/carboxypeptidase